MPSIKIDANEADKTTLNISLTVNEKKKLKIYAAERGITVSAIIQEFISTLDRKEMIKNGTGKVY